jgi:DNA replication protein DnaC
MRRFYLQHEEPEPYTCTECNVTLAYERKDMPLGKPMWSRTACPHEEAEEAQAEAKKKAELRIAEIETSIEAVDLPKRYYGVTFKRIKHDKDNQTVVKTCQEWAKDPYALDKRCLYLYGTVGTGKTTIAVCSIIDLIVNRVDSGSKRRTIAYANAPAWLDMIRKGFDSEDAAKLANRMMFRDIVVLDDIGVENPTEWASERIYLLINRLYEDEIPAILTSNCELDELARRFNRNNTEGTGDRIASRLAEISRQLQLNGPDRRLGK